MIIEKTLLPYEQVIKGFAQENTKIRVDLLEKFGWLSGKDIEDNGYCKQPYGEITEDNWRKSIERGQQKQVKVFFAHDFNPLKDYLAIKKFPILICPIHKLIDIDIYWSYFEWFGYDPREEFRDYTIGQFLEKTKEKKRWYMGYLNCCDDSIVCFNGFDTTLMSERTRYGKVISPNGTEINLNKHNKELPQEMRISTGEMILANICNLHLFLKNKWLKYSIGGCKINLSSFYPNFSKKEVKT